LPIPREHPDKRHLNRILFKNYKKLFDKKCNKCRKDIKTIYNPEKEENIYCNNCYNNEFY